MKTKLIKNFLLSVAGLILLAIANTSLAAGITLSPPKFEFDADQNQIIADVIKITNTNDAELTLNSQVQDFVAGNETGTPNFVNAEDNNSNFSVANWITVNNNEQVTIPAGEKIEVPFVINVPADAEPGGHYGAIFFSTATDGGNVEAVQRIGSLVLIRVGGEISEEGNLDTFLSYQLRTDGDLKEELNTTKIEDLDSGSFFTALPVDFAIRFQNTGNVHVKPYGNIEIYRFGKKLEKIGVQNILENGVPVGQEIVDFLPVNDAEGNVLTDSFRRFDTTYQGEAFWYKNEDGSREIHYKGLGIGKYTAKISLNYGVGHEAIVQEISFVILPWQKILLGLIAIFAIGYSFIRYRRWSHARLEAKIRRSLAKEQKTLQKK